MHPVIGSRGPFQANMAVGQIILLHHWSFTRSRSYLEIIVDVEIPDRPITDVLNVNPGFNNLFPVADINMFNPVVAGIPLLDLKLFQGPDEGGQFGETEIARVEVGLFFDQQVADFG